MRVLHTIQTLSKEAAGVFYFLNNLTLCQRDLGCEVTVVGLPEKASDSDSQLWEHARTEFVRPLGPRSLPFARGLSEILSRVNPDLVHCHGLWAFHSLNVPRLCGERKIPYLVSPHGMLEPWSWRHHAWKKRPVWWLWERRFVHRASALHATSDQEFHNFKRHGLRNPVAVLPVGIGLPEGRQKPEFKPHRSVTRNALFLSRIHPKKGLLNLVAAWSQLRPAGWRMVVCGPDENGHKDKVQRAVAKAGLSDVFDFKPPAYGGDKAALFADADLFVLPTFSENFGIVIPEALASRVPVITTTGTPWEELRTRRCGWWIDTGIDPLISALREATSLSDQERLEMGQRGNQLVEEKYSWPQVGRGMVSVYRWLLGHERQPPCAYLR